MTTIIDHWIYNPKVRACFKNKGFHFLFRFLLLSNQRGFFIRSQVKFLETSKDNQIFWDDLYVFVEKKYLYGINIILVPIRNLKWPLYMMNLNGKSCSHESKKEP